MTTIPAAPTHPLTISWGDLTARCDHPHRVSFHAGSGDMALLTVDDEFTYACDIAIHYDRPGDPNPRRRIPLQGAWYALSWDARLALSPRSSVTALQRHTRMFRDDVLPELGAWLQTDTAADLVAEGTVYWRRQCVIWAASTETDINRALHRVRSIRDAIATGQIPTDDDQRYLRYARMEPR